MRLWDHWNASAHTTAFIWSIGTGLWKSPNKNGKGHSSWLNGRPPDQARRSPLLKTPHQERDGQFRRDKWIRLAAVLTDLRIHEQRESVAQARPIDSEQRSKLLRPNTLCLWRSYRQMGRYFLSHDQEGHRPTQESTFK